MILCDLCGGLLENRKKELPKQPKNKLNFMPDNKFECQKLLRIAI